LTQRLEALNSRIEEKRKRYEKLDSVLGETETSYSKIIDSLGVLLSFASTKGKPETEN
jgi:hypothetical protein